MNHYHLTLFSSSSSSSGFVFTLDRGTPPWIDPTGVWALLILTIRVRSVWWDHLFNTVNNKERGRGQRSVVWLKRGQPCLHHLYVLSTAFSWQPLSSFGLWIILLPSDSRCFLLFGKAVFFLRCLRLRLAFVQSLFLRNLGRQSWRDVRFCVWPWFLLGCLIRNFMVRKFDNSLAAVFSRDGTTVVLRSHA